MSHINQFHAEQGRLAEAHSLGMRHAPLQLDYCPVRRQGAAERDRHCL